MNFIKKYWLLGVIALMVITIICCFAYIFHRINERPLGVQGEMVNPYVLYNTTSTQSATSTAWFGDVNPQVSGLYNLGVNGMAWNNITASGTISATAISATTMSPTNVTWTNATGSNMTVLNNVTINGTCSGVACGSVVGNYTWTNATGTNTTSTNLYSTNATFIGATSTNIAFTSASGTTVNATTLGAYTINMSTGTLASLSLSFLSDTDTGIFSSAANKIDLVTNNSARLSLDASDIIINGTARPLITNNVDLGNPSRSFKNVYASGTIYGSGANFGEGLTSGTSTVRIGKSTGKGCLAIADNDGGGFTYCQTLNGTMTCNTTSCE